MVWRRIGDKPLSWINADPIKGRLYAALAGDQLIDVRCLPSHYEINVRELRFSSLSACFCIDI